jgi:hypothetical protein
MIPKRIPNGHWHMHIAQGDAVEHRNGLVVAGPTVVPPTRDIPSAAQFPSPASWRFAAPFNVHALTLRAGAGSAIRSPTDRPTDCGASIRTSPVRRELGAVWSRAAASCADAALQDVIAHGAVVRPPWCQVPLPDGTLLLNIQADGRWTITL